ncbi:CzcE family metal-binding protein [Chitinimonas sp.]|uniref:CzcE family metal-binding protein n=1 Tax=Chitinimonas sp. TaxID=1934313 RepID=UPI002F9428E3
MLKRTRTLSLIAAGIAATLSLGAFAAPTPHTPAYYGRSVASQGIDQKVEVQPQTRWVNVTNGDTVTFSNGGQTFSWHFDTLHHDDNFDLAEIAPQGFQAGKVRVYVAPNAAELG